MQNSLFSEDHLKQEEAPDVQPKALSETEDSIALRNDGVEQNGEHAQQ